MEKRIEILRDNRKSLTISVSKDYTILVKAPLFMNKDKIMSFVKEKEKWIDKRIEEVERINNLDKLSETQLKELIKKAKKEIPQRVEYYSNILGVGFGKIAIRKQKTRWGSCSVKGNLNFNCLLMLTPSYVIDGVVVHELCHLLEMNHSKRFYNLLLKYYPDYPKAKKWLKSNGYLILGRLK